MKRGPRVSPTSAAEYYSVRSGDAPRRKNPTDCLGIVSYAAADSVLSFCPCPFVSLLSRPFVHISSIYPHQYPSHSPDLHLKFVGGSNAPRLACARVSLSITLLPSRGLPEPCCRSHSSGSSIVNTLLRLPPSISFGAFPPPTHPPIHLSVRQFIPSLIHHGNHRRRHRSRPNRMAAGPGSKHPAPPAHPVPPRRRHQRAHLPHAVPRLGVSSPPPFSTGLC